MKKRFIVMFAMLLLVTGMRSADSVYIMGDFWSTQDETLVTTGEGYNVSIGNNKTTTYQLDVHGDSNFSDIYVNDVYTGDNSSDIRFYDQDNRLILNLEAEHIFNEGHQFFEILDHLGNRIFRTHPALHIFDLNATTDITGTNGFAYAFRVNGETRLDKTVVDFDLTVSDNVNITDGNLNVSDGNIFVRGTDSTATYPYTLNLHNPGETFNYMFIGNDEGGNDQGAFFGLENRAGNDAFTIYNWQGGDIEFLTSPNPSQGFLNFEVKNTGMCNVGDDLTIGNRGLGGGIIRRGYNPGGTINDRGAWESWAFANLVRGYVFVNDDSQLVFNDSAQNKVDDIGEGYIEFDTGNYDLTNYYGEMFFHNDVSPNITGIPTANIWYNVSAFSMDDNGQILNGFSYFDSNLTSIVSGLYEVTYSVSVSGSANNKYHFAVGVDAVPVIIGSESHIRTGNVNDIETDTWVKFVSVDVGEKINLMVQNEDGGNDVTIYSARMGLKRIGRMLIEDGDDDEGGK